MLNPSIQFLRLFYYYRQLEKLKTQLEIDKYPAVISCIVCMIIICINILVYKAINPRNIEYFLTKISNNITVWPTIFQVVFSVCVSASNVLNVHQVDDPE